MIGTERKIFRVGEKLIDFSSPKVMGIINVTPDSFYAGSRAEDIEAILSKASSMITEGAEILDIGAMSSRPGATKISLQEESDRLIPAVKAIRNAHPNITISVDTYRTEILRAAHDVGADIVNDISGGSLDADLLEIVADLQMPYIMMHMQGSPETMQANPSYTDVVMDILSWMTERIYHCKAKGIYDIIIDPGFGFGKTVEDNYSLLRSLETFQILNCPVMVGLSRKSMIYKVLGTDSEGALAGTIAAHVLALQGGATLLRAHDVREAKQAIQIFQSFRNID